MESWCVGLSQSSQGATDALNDDRFPGVALLMSEWLQSRSTIVCGVCGARAMQEIRLADAHMAEQVVPVARAAVHSSSMSCSPSGRGRDVVRRVGSAGRHGLGSLFAVLCSSTRSKLLFQADRQNQAVSEVHVMPPRKALAMRHPP